MELCLGYVERSVYYTYNVTIFNTSYFLWVANMSGQGPFKLPLVYSIRAICSAIQPSHLHCNVPAGNFICG